MCISIASLWKMGKEKGTEDENLKPLAHLSCCLLLEEEDHRQILFPGRAVLFATLQTTILHGRHQLQQTNTPCLFNPPCRENGRNASCFCLSAKRSMYFYSCLYEFFLPGKGLPNDPFNHPISHPRHVGRKHPSRKYGGRTAFTS